MKVLRKGRISRTSDRAHITRPSICEPSVFHNKILNIAWVSSFRMHKSQVVLRVFVHSTGILGTTTTAFLFSISSILSDIEGDYRSFSEFLWEIAYLFNNSNNSGFALLKEKLFNFPSSSRATFSRSVAGFFFILVLFSVRNCAESKARVK